MGVEKHEVVVSYGVGDRVTIVDGTLSNFTGTVESIDNPRQQGARDCHHART